jgi:hypothetical protein
MDRRDITRIMLEGLLNGIGFVIGSAIVGLVVSVVLGLTHHPMILAALPIIGVVMWLSFRGRRFVKARLERVKIEEFGHALRSSVVASPSNPRRPTEEAAAKRGRAGAE